LNEPALTRRQQKRRDRLQRVANWRQEKVANTHEEQINQSWRQHRAYLRDLDQGNAATSAGVSTGNKQNGERREDQEHG
jgi:hypothetical protein